MNSLAIAASPGVTQFSNNDKVTDVKKSLIYQSLNRVRNNRSLNHNEITDAIYKRESLKLNRNFD